MSQKIDGSVCRMRSVAQVVVYLGFILSYCNAELIITRPPKNATVLQDTRFLMHCEAAGPTKPRIKWFHNDEEMPRSGENYRIGSTGKLRFRDVKVSDRGKYRCKVETGRETLYSNLAYLVVEVEVDIIRTTPTSGKVIITDNSDVRLTCVAASIPGPQMQWRKNGESIIDEYKHNVQIEERWEAKDKVLESVLTARNLTTSTKFECEAVNQHIGGDTVRSKTFEVIVRPKNGQYYF